MRKKGETLPPGASEANTRATSGLASASDIGLMRLFPSRLLNPRSRCSGTSDQDDGEEDQHPADDDLECRRQERRSHEPHRSAAYATTADLRRSCWTFSAAAGAIAATIASGVRSASVTIMS